MRYKTLPLFSYSSMNERWLGRPTRTCDLGVSLIVDKHILVKQHATWRFVSTSIQMLMASQNQPHTATRQLVTIDCPSSGQQQSISLN